jgi:hypothetical protein
MRPRRARLGYLGVTPAGPPKKELRTQYPALRQLRSKLDEFAVDVPRAGSAAARPQSKKS